MSLFDGAGGFVMTSGDDDAPKTTEEPTMSLGTSFSGSSSQPTSETSNSSESSDGVMSLGSGSLFGGSDESSTEAKVIEKKRSIHKKIQGNYNKKSGKMVCLTPEERKSLAENQPTAKIKINIPNDVQKDDKLTKSQKMATLARYKAYSEALSKVKLNQVNVSTLHNSNNQELILAKSTLMKFLHSKSWLTNDTGLFTISELIRHKVLDKVLYLSRHSKKSNYLVTDYTVNELLDAIEKLEVMVDQDLDEFNFLTFERLGLSLTKISPFVDNFDKEKLYKVYMTLNKYRYIINSGGDYTITNILKNHISSSIRVYRTGANGTTEIDPVDKIIRDNLENIDLGPLLYFIDSTPLIKDGNWDEYLIKITNGYIPKVNQDYIDREKFMINAINEEAEDDIFQQVKSRVEEVLQNVKPEIIKSISINNTFSIKLNFRLPELKINEVLMTDHVLVRDNKYVKALIVKLVDLYTTNHLPVPGINDDYHEFLDKLSSLEIVRLKGVLRRIRKMDQFNRRYNTLISKEYMRISDYAKSKPVITYSSRVDRVSSPNSDTPGAVLSISPKSNIVDTSDNWNNLQELINLIRKYVLDIANELVIDIYDLIRHVDITPSDTDNADLIKFNSKNIAKPLPDRNPNKGNNTNSLMSVLPADDYTAENQKIENERKTWFEKLLSISDEDIYKSARSIWSDLVNVGKDVADHKYMYNWLVVKDPAAEQLARGTLIDPWLGSLINKGSEYLTKKPVFEPVANENIIHTFANTVKNVFERDGNDGKYYRRTQTTDTVDDKETGDTRYIVADPFTSRDFNKPRYYEYTEDDIKDKKFNPEEIERKYLGYNEYQWGDYNNYDPKNPLNPYSTYYSYHDYFADKNTRKGSENLEANPPKESINDRLRQSIIDYNELKEQIKTDKLNEALKPVPLPLTNGGVVDLTKIHNTEFARLDKLINEPGPFNINNNKFKLISGKEAIKVKFNPKDNVFYDPKGVFQKQAEFNKRKIKEERARQLRARINRLRTAKAMSSLLGVQIDPEGDRVAELFRNPKIKSKITDGIKDMVYGNIFSNPIANQIKDGFAQVDKGLTKGLSDVSSYINKGVDEFKNGVGRINNFVYDVTEGFKQIRDTGKQVQGFVNTFNKNGEAFAEVLKENNIKLPETITQNLPEFIKKFFKNKEDDLAGGQAVQSFLSDDIRVNILDIRMDDQSLFPYILTSYYEENDYLNARAAKRILKLRIPDRNNDTLSTLEGTGKKIQIIRGYSKEPLDPVKADRLVPIEHLGEGPTSIYETIYYNRMDVVEEVYIGKIVSRDKISKDKEEMSQEEREIFGYNDHTMVFYDVTIEVIPILLAKDTDVNTYKHPLVSYIPKVPPKEEQMTQDGDPKPPTEKPMDNPIPVDLQDAKQKLEKQAQEAGDSKAVDALEKWVADINKLNKTVETGIKLAGLTANTIQAGIDTVKNVTKNIEDGFSKIASAPDRLFGDDPAVSAIFKVTSGKGGIQNYNFNYKEDTNMEVYNGFDTNDEDKSCTLTLDMLDNKENYITDTNNKNILYIGNKPNDIHGIPVNKTENKTKAGYNVLGF